MSTDKELSKETIAAELLLIYKKIEELKIPLEDYKEKMRNLAEGDKLEIVVPDMGKVSVTQPRKETQKIIFEINNEKIEKNKVLKDMLLEKGVMKEVTVKTPAAKASVNIKTNV